MFKIVQFKPVNGRNFYFRNVKTRAFKALQTLEKDLSTLYHIQTKYLEKLALKNNKQQQSNGVPASSTLTATTTTSTNSISTTRYSSQSKTSSAYLAQSKQIEKLVNHTPIGVLKRSQLGQPMRLIYYLSPMDLIQYHTQSQFSSTYKVVESSHLTVDDLIEHDLGAYCTISLVTSSHRVDIDDAADGHRLADASTLVLSEIQDERVWHEYLSPYLNFNFDFERMPLFNATSTITSGTKNKSSQATTQIAGVKIPGCFVLRLNKPVVMCVSTLDELQQRIGECV